jgi:pimeloyl-ACP methyl ester carboxylesterase
VIERAIDHIGESRELDRDRQAGWLATIYAARRPEHVNTLAIAGAPIDFHAGEPVIHAALRWLAPGDNLAFYRRLVAAAGGVLRGEHMLAGFIAINSDNEIARQMQLLANLDDPPTRSDTASRGLVQAHSGDPRRFLSLDRRAPLPRQRADRQASWRSAASTSSSAGSSVR